MPFFTPEKAEIAARQPTTQAEIQRVLDYNREQQAMSDALGLKILLVMAILAFAALAALYARRRAIAKAADGALIGGAAGALRGARAARKSWGQFWGRVEDRAR